MRAYEEHEFNAIGFDIENIKDPTMKFLQDMNSPMGFCTAVRFALQMKRRSLASLAIVCSNLIFLCRSKTGRDQLNGFWGNLLYAKVRESNCMIQRVIMLATFMVCYGVRWLIEQPQSSVLKNMGSESNVALDFIPAPYSGSERRTVQGHMGSFGHANKKASYWVGDAEFLPEMHQPLESSRFAKTELVVHRPDGRVTGNKEAVHATQAYTREYGLHIFHCWKTSVEVACGIDTLQPDHVFDESDSDSSLADEDNAKLVPDDTVNEFWKHMRMDELAEELNVPTRWMLCSQSAC